MFDPITTALINSAPLLDGLDLDDLPKRLTEAFADIVSARIRLRGIGGDEHNPALSKTLLMLGRLAAAQEAYVALLPERENRAAAAFVAASAHEACLLARGGRGRSRVDAAMVSSEVCATLLFLVAEAHADAAETAKRIQTSDDGISPVETALLTAIQFLAQGRLGAIGGIEIPEIFSLESEPSDLALQALQLMLLKGVKSLALQLRRRVNIVPAEGGVESAVSIFTRVKQLCVEPIDGVLDLADPVYSLYPGPLHLANLLLSVERNLIETALSRIRTPGNVEEDGWWHIIRRMARQRPYLWRNHREAIEKGYLEKGTSSAISFPTGGGKSTLAELKIATALLRNEKVVFLAPTHALVAQTTRSLKNTFQSYEILGDIDEDITFNDVVVLPEVVVTTPERCLMLLSLQPEAFADLGLVVFDECHLLHPRDEDRSRRGIDAMLAILNLTMAAPEADLLLLSAMMKNTQDIAAWIKTITGRDCLPLDLAWKPTRQVRGCVVYPAEQISGLKTKLAQARIDFPTHKDVPAAIKREILSQPYGLFSLRQTWSTTNREDYALLPLQSSTQPLSSGRRRNGSWYPTPNGNQTSGSIAAAAVAGGMKTLVFVQTTVFCDSCVKDFSSRLDTRTVTFTEEEAKWRALAVEEMGAAEHCYLQLDNDGLFRGGAASHHGLLLREERELHESLFKRAEGIDVLFATSTLAQGMNLPSQVVIISGDSRFDPDVDKMQKLEAHELLNAAGRAGRAGDGAQGFVLLVPSKVIDFDDQNNRISGHWMELQAIFEQSDQCLVIEDPMRHVLDQIHHGITMSGMPAYVLGKLPLSITSSDVDPARTLLNRTLAVYQARANGDVAWADSRVAAAIAARSSVELPEQQKWIERVAGSTGISVLVLQQLVDIADQGGFDGTAGEVVGALLNWLAGQPILLMDLVRPESLEGLFGDKYKKLATDADRAAVALPAISALVPLWMSGVPLRDLEIAFLGPSKKLGRCEYARHFVSRIVPDLAFVAGLPARLLAARAKESEDPTALTTVLSTLAGIVREGSDSPEVLATRLNAGRGVSRVAARQHYNSIKAFAPAGSPIEEFEQTRERMRNADLISKFAALD
ncbi:DEAD/DEAH box helicase [Mesorhizobium sp. M0091]|uniref:DEAD/DEAH box helicase n=1 Tax=Mesorhizobium sp. M0091 TaxID=2956875 RepID=UPI0033350D13